MDRYIDIRLRPDPEFREPLLMSALFSKLHRGLAELGTGEIGISLPDHQDNPRSTGARLRLHGSDEALSKLFDLTWLNGMHDHVKISEMRNVPANASHRVVSRAQPKTNAERLRRRYAKRHGVSEDEARRLIPDSVEAHVSLPFVTVRSRSSGRSFALFIKHMPAQENAVPGPFSTYGLSTVATVPWF